MGLGFPLASGDVFRPGSNIAALNNLNLLRSITRELNARQLRIATGQAQPRVEDGPSFFSLQNKMNNQVRGKQMALDNIGDAKDMLGVAEAGLRQIDGFLGQMRDLVVRGASDTLTAEQRDDMHRELLQLAMAIDLVANNTKFNESDPLLGGGYKAVIQTGPNETPMDMLMIQLGDFSAGALGVNLGEIQPASGDNGGQSGGAGVINVLNNANAKRSITQIDDAINAVKDQLNNIGGTQRKLTALEEILGASIAAEQSQASRFGDANIADEQMAIARLQLQQQLATQGFAQANVSPTQFVAGFLGGGR